MKKTARVMTMALAAVMLVSVLSVVGFAVPAAASYNVTADIYESNKSKFGDPSVNIESAVLPNGSYAMAEDQVRIGDSFFDLAGSVRYKDIQNVAGVGISNGINAQYLPVFDLGYNNVVFAYAPHHHKISPNAPWHYDENNHWKDCETCPCWLFMNWHHDINDDGICDECHQPIVYRKLSVKDVEGGKVTISAEKGTVGDRVAVTVKADPGYKLVDLRGMNTTAKKYSFRPCIQDVKGSEYHFFVDVCDVEVVAKFVKE